MPGLQKVAAALVAPGKGILAADASIATMHVIMYRRNVPKLLTSVMTTELWGTLAAKSWLQIPKLYQTFWYLGSSAAGVVPPR